MDRLRVGDYLVSPIAQHRDAVAFIKEQHYALGAANTSTYRHGLFRRDEDKILGVALWIPPTKAAGASVNRSNPHGVLSLSRLCVDASVPTNGASFLLGRSMRLIDRDRWPTLLTYADTYYGHTGAIYKATNWTCLGEVPGSDSWIDAGTGERRGRKRGGRTLLAAEMKELGFTRLPTRPKIKFVHP